MSMADGPELSGTTSESLTRQPARPKAPEVLRLCSCGVLLEVHSERRVTMPKPDSHDFDAQFTLRSPGMHSCPSSR